MKLPYFLLLVSVFLPQTRQRENPGLRVRVTKRALERLVPVFKKTVDHQLKRFLKVMPRTDNSGTVIIHKIDTLKNVLPDVNFNLKAPNQLQLKSNGGKSKFEIEMTVVQENGQRDRGITEVSFGGVELKLDFGFERKADGKLDVQLDNCEFSVADLDVKADDALPTVRSKLAILNMGPLKFFLPQLVCSQLKSVASSLGEKLVNFNMRNIVVDKKILNLPHGVTLNDEYIVDFGLVNDVKVTREYVEFDVKAAFLKASMNKSTWSFRPASLVDKRDNSRMFHVLLSDESVSQLFRELYDDLSVPLPAEYTDRIKAEMAIHANHMGFNVLRSDELSIEVSLPEAPVIKFVGDDDFDIDITVPKLKLQLQQRRDGAVVAEPIMLLYAKGRHNMTLETEIGKRYPKIVQKGRVDAFKLLSLGHFVDPLSPAYKTQMRADYKADDELCAKVLSRDLEGIGDFGFVKADNFHLKFSKGTVEAAFDLELDPTKMLNVDLLELVVKSVDFGRLSLLVYWLQIGFVAFSVVLLLLILLVVHKCFARHGGTKHAHKD